MLDKLKNLTVKSVFNTAVGAAFFLSIVATAGSTLISGLMWSANDIEKRDDEIVYSLKVPGVPFKAPLMSFTSDTIEETKAERLRVLMFMGGSALLMGALYPLNKRLNAPAAPEKKAEAPSAAPPPADQAAGTEIPPAGKPVTPPAP